MRGLALLLFACVSSSVYAEQLICQGNLRNKTIQADLIVQQRCILDNANIQGNIEVKNAASLTLKRSRISGDVHAHDYFSGIHIEESHIAGKLSVHAGRDVRLIKNQVAGDIDVQDNIGTVLIKQNQSQALICVHNRIQPTGFANQATQKLEQCAAL